MEAKLINPFIKAVIEVIKTMAFVTPSAGKPYLKKDDVAKGDVSGIIGITGDNNGTVSISFDEASILQIVSNMFGEEIKEVSNEVADAVGEITNMISGKARQELDNGGIHFDGAIPSVFAGKGHTITHITEGPKIAIPFKTDKGSFTMEVCFET